MDIKNFFDDKGKVESFLKAKTEQEAKSILESECGKVSDDEFNEIKKGFLTALSEEALGEASGGINMSALKSPLAKTVYKVGGVTLAGLGIFKISYNIGKKSGYDQGYTTGYSTGRMAGAGEVEERYNQAKDNLQTWVEVGGYKYLSTGVDPTYHQIVPKK